HGLIPPHPAALLAVQQYGADIGKTIAYGLMIGVPIAIVAGPLFALTISKFVKLPESNPLAAQFVESHTEGKKRELPGFGITLLTILLPVILMLVGSWADLIFTPKSLPNNLLRLAGNSDVALLIAVLVSFFTFGKLQGF
ncbi:permease DsdX, partial [Burkholderia stagnalis]|uniref:GntP family permease n=1 Tax=Burkholderia stagnalis TaxID=1503054 RepID=UPI000F9ADD27